MANEMRGCELWSEVALALNEIILNTNDSIQIDNHAGIWNPFLHKYTNEDWDDMLAALEGMTRVDGTKFRDYDRTNMITARQLLDTGIMQGKPRVLDKRETKRTAWAMIMTMREVYNRFYDIDLPNKPGQGHKPKNNYSQLFGE